jgi:hypothetical protein
MFIDEDVLSLAEAGASLPRRRTPATLWRWCAKGLHGVKLEHRWIGGTIVTSRQAVDRFLSDVTAARSEALAKATADARAPDFGAEPEVMEPPDPPVPLQRAQAVLKRAGF